MTDVTGTKPTFITQNSNHNIYYIEHICNINTNQWWQVSDWVSIPDHRWIKFSQIIGTLPSKLARDPRKTGRENVFILTVSTLHVNYSDVQKLIPPLACQRQRQIHRCQPKLEQPRALAKKDFNKATNSKLDDDWDVYKVHFREYKKVGRQKDAWRTSVGEIENFPKAARPKGMMVPTRR